MSVLQLFRLCGTKSSVADPGCLSRIRIFSIPDPHQRIKYFNQKGSRNYDPDSSPRIRILICLPIQDPGRGQKCNGSRTGSKRHRFPDPQHWLNPDPTFFWRKDGGDLSCAIHDRTLLQVNSADSGMRNLIMVSGTERYFMMKSQKSLSSSVIVE
jgi:hypothetical protein